MRYGAIIATALITAGLVAALFIVGTAGPAGRPPDPAGASPSLPLVIVTGPDGRAVRVPVTLPRDCRLAYARMAPALLGAREALKSILRGEPRASARASLDRSNIALRGASLAAEVTADLLDCGSQDIAAATAYREAREAVHTASITASLLGDGHIPSSKINFLEVDLATIESALAQF